MRDTAERIGGFYLTKRPHSLVWYVTWFDEGRRQTTRRSTRTRDLTEAQAFLAEHYLHRRELRDEPTAAVALAVILDRYLLEHARKIASRETAEAAVRHWKQFWQDAAVSDLNVARQEEFIAFLKKRLSDGSVARVLSVGRAALRRAHLRQEINSAPPVVPYSAPQVYRDRVLSIAEAGALWRAARNVEHWRRYLWLAFGTAARPGAILALTGAQIDFRAQVIHLAPHGWVQNKKRRPTLPMGSKLAAELKRWKAGADEVLVAYNGKAMKRARESFKRLSKIAGVECTAYTIRHTVATELRRMNVPEWDVAGFLGHRGPGSATTARYAHYRPDFMRKSAAAVDAYLTRVLRASLRATPKHVKRRKA